MGSTTRTNCTVSATVPIVFNRTSSHFESTVIHIDSSTPLSFISANRTAFHNKCTRQYIDAASVGLIIAVNGSLTLCNYTAADSILNRKLCVLLNCDNASDRTIKYISVKVKACGNTLRYGYTFNIGFQKNNIASGNPLIFYSINCRLNAQKSFITDGSYGFGHIIKCICTVFWSFTVIDLSLIAQIIITNTAVRFIAPVRRLRCIFHGTCLCNREISRKIGSCERFINIEVSSEI